MRSRAPQPLHPSGPAADPGIAHGRRTFRSGRQRLEASALVFEFLLRAPIQWNGGGKGLRRYRFEDGRDALWLEARLRTSDHHQPPVASLVEIGIFAPITGSAQSGTKISAVLPTWRPKNPACATPMISKGCLLSETLRPS